MKKNKNVYDGAEMVPENVENTHKKGKSLTGRIFRWMCLAVGGSLMLVCIINILLSYTYLKQALVNEMDEVVHTASNTISNQLESVVNAITQISADADFSDVADVSAIRSKCISVARDNSMYVKVDMTDRDGKGLNDDSLNWSDDPAYREVIETNKAVVGEPYFYEKTGKVVMDVTVPIISNDINRLLRAVLRITVDVNVFSNVIGQISIGDTGYAMVVDAKGNIIAHPDSELIPQQMNYISLASQDGSYQAMADCVSSAIAGESGFGEVTLDGVSKYVSYAPISNAEGWSCIMIATPSEHTQSIYNSVVIGMIVTVVCFALSVLLIITIVKKIISPVKQCSDRIVTLSHGDLHQQELDFGKKIDKEISQLSESTNLISKNINEIISDIDTMLRTLGNGDLTYKPADVYLGDFAPIRQSYESIMISLNKTMDKISKAGQRVATGSEQVASAAGSLSGGAAKQAASVEELSASLTEVAEKVNRNAARAENAAENSAQATKLVESGNEQMNGLLAGETVDMPVFDFVKGSKRYGTRITRAEEDQPIVIEGIHALNDKLTEDIPEEEKYRIYISPLTTLNIDDNNRIPVSDLRLVRRIARDIRSRGRTASQTLSEWVKVRAGEVKNIFPYSVEADVFFNSAFMYEWAMLKPVIKDSLEEIREEDENYLEAERLLRILRCVRSLKNSEDISNNSIMREFIGGGIWVK